ncbi:MAG: hypothetical protein AAF710_10235 [Planctomycetota bacterium]
MKPWIERLRANIRGYIRADGKRAAAAALLLTAGMLLWGRLLLKQVPQTASADDKPAWLMEVEAEAEARPAEARAVVEADRPGPLGRDPFLLDPKRYRRALSEEEVVSGAKLPAAMSDEAKRMAVAEAAAELRLQSVTLGEVPAAFINGRLVRLGGTIEGFTLTACDERSAVLERHGVRVRLRMGF